MCCHCSLKWQIDVSDEADVLRWCNEIIMIQLFQKNERKEKKLIAYCALLYTLVFFIVVHQFSKFPQVNWGKMMRCLRIVLLENILK
jgi:hypothetical protein